MESGKAIGTGKDGRIIRMTGPFTITVYWPAKTLSPNARVHWSVKSRAKAAAREEAHIQTIFAKARNLPWAGLQYDLACYPPIKRHRDEDNILASIKAHLDGIADATGIDDRYFRRGTFTICEPDKARPRIEITIRELSREHFGP
jgi:crossover junction endodeoxyribonuclease RusA